jgi:hypothetical protein
VADPNEAGKGGDPPRGRESLLMSGLALLWVACFAAVSQFSHGTGVLVWVFWATLGGGLLSLAGLVLAVSGILQGRQRRLSRLGLLLSIFNLLALSGAFFILG